MKLALLGAAVLVLGLVLSVPGLIAAGALWIATGPLARAYGEQRAARLASARDGTEVAGRGFVLGVLILLAIGLPSLALGIFEIGFPDDERDWRFVPIAVGGLLTALALVSGGMVAIGSGLMATADAIGVPQHRATITVRSVRETGTYVNERPRLELELTVEPDGLPPYEVTKRATVPHTALGSIRPGAGFRAIVDPDKPEAMQIDWESASGGGASERIDSL